ncbi:long-chain fatty acid--CoA ligase [Roseovarius spongiae]|uniref:Long-chain fatty acid--CoA ligase n=1 Tax=Roseovarius spongiae TaxID=2320272 RepID=A0A3A8B7V6_9RHOB|nr:long-chain fatty acid--CoA ligase [Roseovarius spongiae]
MPGGPRQGRASGRKTTLAKHPEPVEGLASIPALLQRNATQYANRPAYREKEFGIWQCWTWAEAEREIEALALGLIDMGVAEGDFVAVVGRNRPYFYWAIVAVQSIGAVPVTLYHDASADEMAFVMEHCGARLAIVEDQEQVDKVIEVQDGLSKFEQMIYIDPRGLRKYDHGKLHAYSDIQEKGRARRADLLDELEARRGKLDYDSICVMLYTSGTTGKPKGVVLSNRNIIEASKSSSEFDNLRPKEEVLAYLPMAWVGDFIFSIGQAYWCGFCVNCPESADTMQVDLREIGPTYYFAPPRVFETQLTSVMIRMEDAGRTKKWLFDHFMAHARKVGGDILDGKPVGAWDRLKYGLGNLLVYGPLKNTLGLSRVRVGYTAGEAIGPEIFSFYRSLGINLKQLYGQTEASVFITLQPDGEVRADTVGVPAPGVEIRIAEDGEVFYRSPGVFECYYKNEESTKSTKDPEGWVATGDAGFFDDETGQLRIIDRAKDVGKMANGALFAPKYVENKLKFFPNILEAVVFGNEREECTAFINIDLTAVGNWAERNNIGYASYQELAGHPRVLDTIREHVEEVNRSLADDPMLGHCQVHRFLVLHKELDADDGEMTRTRKVRRGVISEKFDDLLGALYDGSDEIFTKTEVTYEDGRKGSISATLKIVEAAVKPVEDARQVAAE